MSLSFQSVKFIVLVRSFLKDYCTVNTSAYLLHFFTLCIDVDTRYCSITLQGLRTNQHKILIRVMVTPISCRRSSFVFPLYLLFPPFGLVSPWVPSITLEAKKTYTYPTLLRLYKSVFGTIHCSKGIHETLLLWYPRFFGRTTVTDLSLIYLYQK